MGPKINVKERFTDGEIDLSMSDLEEVPVKEIAQLRKAYSLDLSNNRLSLLPKNFVTLNYLTKLDLSKNELKELPEDFGSLNKLKYLDLYQNQLQHLPLSFSKLKDLKWLDLKDNPLVPTVAKIAGPCLDTKQCQNCARDVVNFFVKLEHQVNTELETRNKTRQRQLEINQQKKQEEKKGKKKEKQKQKQEQTNAEKNGSTKGKSKKESNRNKNNKVIVVTQGQTSSSFISQLVTVLLFTIIILFVLTSVKCKWTENVELFVRGLFTKTTEKLPEDWKIYGIEVGYFIRNVHEKTGNLTLKITTYINENVISKEKQEEVLEDVRDFIHRICDKVKDIYGQLVTGE